MQCLLPSEEETTINVNFSDGQEPITIDAIDIDLMYGTVLTNPIPEGSTVEHELTYLFKQRFKRKISRAAMVKLWELSDELLRAVKKKLLKLPAQSDTMEQPAT